MGLQDLKAKLAALAAGVKTSVASVATELIEKAKAKATEKAAKAERAREQKFFLDALPGTKEEKVKRLDEVEQAVAEYQEICKLLDEAELELARAKNAAPADKDRLVAEASAVIAEVKAEKERIETDPDIKFFGWLKWIESQTENPDRRTAIGEIDQAIANGFLREITGERAREIQAAGKAAKKEERQLEERPAPFFWVRVKPRGSTPQGEQEPDDHFRYVSGGVDFYARSVEGARKRLVFFALQDLWKACTEAKKAAFEVTKEVKEHSYLTLADVAAGKTGQAWAEVTEANPWRPVFFDHETGQAKPFVKDGKEIVNFGPVVVESPRPGVLRVLNTVQSGMFRPLRLAGAWEEKDGKQEPVEFKFFVGNNPRTGQPNNFAGLRPVKDEIDRTPNRLGRLRVILCLAGGLQAPAKEANGKGSSEEMLPEEGTPTTRREYRSDGSKADESRRGKERKKSNGRNSHDEVPEVPRDIRASADLEEE